MKSFSVIAEIGCSHGGSLKRAKELAMLAKLCGADVVKTQKRNPKESVKKELWDKPHPNQMFAYGKTYLEHREKLELPIEQHSELKQYCEEIGIEYSSSVWDMTSTKEMIALSPKLIKVPSACNTNKEMLIYLFDNYNGQIHISLGMLSRQERNNILGFIFEEYCKKRGLDTNKLIVYHCTSGYPVPFEQLHLKDIFELSEGFFPVGFSNHGYGIAMEPVAYALGARYFERHFIDDRLYRHTDAACSLEPTGLSKLVRDLKAVERALTLKPEQLEEIEQIQRDKLKMD